MFEQIKIYLDSFDRGEINERALCLWLDVYVMAEQPLNEYSIPVNIKHWGAQVIEIKPVRKAPLQLVQKKVRGI